MKKKILLLAVALMMFMGIVSASSINGDYKGNPIVKVMSNGKQLETDEVPAVILDGHTVVPISTLRQLGASVTWDAYGYSVDVKLPNQTVSVEPDSLKFIDSVEMYRYLYFVNEQAAAAFQLMPLIDTISNSQSDNQRMTDQINRLRVDTNSDWVRNLTLKPGYSNDLSKLNQIDKSLIKVKNSLLRYDTNTAINEWNTLKTNINDLYSKYDFVLMNSINEQVQK